MVTDHGDLATITAEEALIADVARVAFGLLAQASSPITGGGGNPGGGGGGVLGTSLIPGGGNDTGIGPSSLSPGSGTVPDDGGVLTESGPGSSGPGSGGGGADSGGSGGGSGSGAGSGGGGGGRLPFTGYALMGVAALGAGVASTSVALRRLMGRDVQ